MSGTMLSTLHTFPPEERHHNISMGRHIILIFHKENKAPRGCMAESNFGVGPFGLLERLRVFGRRIVPVGCTRTHCKGCGLS